MSQITKVPDGKRLEVVYAIAKGFPLTKALGMSNCYSRTTISHASVAVVSGKPYRATMRQFAEVMADQIGEQSIGAELELLRVGKAPFREIRVALQTIWKAYSAKVDGTSVTEFKAANGSQYAVIKQRFHDKFWSPGAQAKIQEMREKSKALQPGDLTAMSRVGIAEELLNPPSDARSRNANRRLAMESEGAIGNNLNQLHLHQHNNYGDWSPTVRKMMVSKMIEIEREKHPEMSHAEIARKVEAELGVSSTDVIPEKPEPIAEDDAEIVTTQEKTQDNVFEVSEAEATKPHPAPDVDLPNDGPRREIVTNRGFVRQMHEFLGVE